MRRTSVRLLILLISIPLTLIKVGSLNIASFILTVSPGFSVVSMGFLAVLVVSELRGKPVMRQTDWIVFLGFNLILGGYLYLSVLGLSPYDAYAVGDSFSWIFISTAIFTIMLIIMKNPIAIFYVLSIAAWDYRMLAHSQNFFDYIMDGPLFIASVVGIMVLIRKARVRQTS